MRKWLSIVISVFLMLSLTGCTVNWFDGQCDVPWFVVAIPVAIVFVIAHIHVMSGTYVCPECGTEFKPKWYQISAYLHFMGERLIKCPNCKKTSFCKRK